MSSVAYEEEEGYGSGGEYDLAYDQQTLSLSKIRVKLHYQDDVRGMTMTPDITFEEFVERVTSKFGRGSGGGRGGGMTFKFRDEDGGMVTLRDESDFELAVETAREVAKMGGKGGAMGGAEGKLEVWCQDS
jgi:hypothetical protein